MPTNPKNQLGDLSVNDPDVSQSFLLKLNDRLRRISQIISGGNTTINNNNNTTIGGGGASEVVLTVPGVIGVESDAAPAITLGSQTSFSTVVLLLKQAPQGANVTVQLYVAGATWGGPLSMNGTSASFTAAGGSIAANAIIRLDITGVGTTYPGSDLTVILR